MGTISPPQPLSESHDLADFRSGNDALDDWLQRKARSSEKGGAARTLVLCDDDKVIGFYSLSASSVEHVRVPGNVRRNMPSPIPVILLGQFAVHVDYQGKGIGKDLLADALKRAVKASAFIGARAVVLMAIDSKAKHFYEGYGFKTFSEEEPFMLYLRVSVIEAMLG